MATLTTKERWEQTAEYVRKQNEPYKEAVCVNNANNGDDNDYSCFLTRVCMELYKTKRIELAYQLYLTDPMLMVWKSREEFELEMQAAIQREELVDEW